MEIVGFYNCLNLNEAKIKEQEHFVALNATLNSIEPVPTRNEKIVRMIPINKHNDKIDKQPNLVGFNCEKCDFKCFKKSNYNLHLLTAKHEMTTESPKNAIPYTCSCGKQYKYRQGLHVHKLKCDKLSLKPDNERLVLDLMIQNKELIDLLVSHNNDHKVSMKETMVDK
jgi:hypothetical protein